MEDIRMSKKKILNKPVLTWNDIEEADIDLNKVKSLKEVKPEEFFKDQAKIGAALLECLLENDTEAFIEILDEYLKVNRSRVARDANIGRSTVQEVFSKKGNPTLKTIAKIVHYSAGFNNLKDHYKR
jgi:DNA-binding phage protein